MYHLLLPRSGAGGGERPAVRQGQEIVQPGKLNTVASCNVQANDENEGAAFGTEECRGELASAAILELVKASYQIASSPSSPRSGLLVMLSPLPHLAGCFT